MATLGPEDSKAWRTQKDESITPATIVCRSCGEDIYYWHCTEAGCPWCKECAKLTKG